MYNRLKKGKRRPQYETKPTLQLDERLGKKKITEQENKICTKKYIEMNTRNSNCSNCRK